MELEAHQVQGGCVLGNICVLSAQFIDGDITKIGSGTHL
jgi:hypothetical protein